LPLRLRKNCSRFLSPIFPAPAAYWTGGRANRIVHGSRRGAPAAQHPICELELELKSGEPRQLFELALALLEIAA
jgi:hypothetical protein